jgi:hypothetical protein
MYRPRGRPRYGGTVNGAAPIGDTDRATIGKHMAGH